MQIRKLKKVEYMSYIVNKIKKLGIIPVIVLDRVEDAKPLAEALINGGLPCAEITFRTDAAEESIRIMTTKFPEMLVGAGTVLTTEQVDRAVNAGAKFIVSPGLNPRIVKYCVERNILIVPGTSNPSDIEVAIELGLDLVKFFPAEAAGGLNMIKSLAAPYTKMKFIPTGGINAKNLKSYLDFDKIICCGGTWMIDKTAIEARDFEKITTLTKEAVNTMLAFEVKRIGINMTSEAEAEVVATAFDNMFGFEKKVGNSSIFAGTGIEVLKSPSFGTHGHIAVATNYIDRAIYQMQNHGFEFDMQTASYNEKGKLVAIYLKGEVGNFAIHLLQK